MNNHEQALYGLRYSMTAWELGVDFSFHEELGYWLWDPKASQVLRCLVIPRGVTLIAGGTAEPDAKEFELVAEVGSETYGICSNLFLHEEFKTVRYRVAIKIQDANSFSYEQTSELAMKGRTALFQHTDCNTLRRVK